MTSTVLSSPSSPADLNVTSAATSAATASAAAVAAQVAQQAAATLSNQAAVSATDAAASASGAASSAMAASAAVAGVPNTATTVATTVATSIADAALVGVINASGGTIDGGSLVIGPITDPDTQGTGLSASSLITANRAGDYQAMSLIVINQTISANTALNLQTEATAFQTLIETYCYPPATAPGVQGNTYIANGMATVRGLPPGETIASLKAQFVGNPLLPPIEVSNFVLNNSGIYLDTGLVNAEVGLELDHQLGGGFDTVAGRTAFIHNLDVAPILGGTGTDSSMRGGIPTMSTSFESIALATGSIATAYRAAGNVQCGVVTRDANPIVAQITAAPTTVAAGAPPGTTVPAAPPSIGGGAVVHVGPTTPFTSFYSGLVGFAHGTESTTTVSPTNRLRVQLNGNTYHVVGIQWDGPYYNSGYLQLAEALLNGDGALGQFVTAQTFGVLMTSFQCIGYDETGAITSYYDPTQFGGQGAVVTTSSVAHAGSLSFGTGQSLGGAPTLYPCTYSPRDGGHWFQWNPYTNQTEWYDGLGGTSNLRLALNLGTGLASPLGLTVGGKQFGDASGNVYTSAGHLNVNHVVAAVGGSTPAHTVATEQLALLTATATLPTLAVTLPTPLGNGDTRRFTVSQGVTALTVNNAAGTALAGFPASLAAGTGVTCVYDSATSTWYSG